MQKNSQFRHIEDGKKIFFASDFHLGMPNKTSGLERERKIIKWLESIKAEAAGIILAGDVFDFWFEYKHTAPKGYIRFLGKLAELSDSEIPVIFFSGNHDMWMGSYLEEELGVTIYHNPVVFTTKHHTLFVGHGDGLGPGDYRYKILKKFFKSPLCRWLFHHIHPDIGFGIANFWSSKSRLNNDGRGTGFQNEKEWLFQYALKKENEAHHDFYIFGHRHIHGVQRHKKFQYINLGEWVHHTPYAVYDGNTVELLSFES